ncbi:hypothetical protein RhiJN_03829 [Ceratobasidium sp. AG-Ba]|nr:hypothetical protein RhiJN_03829 [Ceratobasidium sp. AG-Ba]QRW04723.1 methyltransferase domain protein [Ceratobasidium sp. AG-Ba]
MQPRLVLLSLVLGNLGVGGVKQTPLTTSEPSANLDKKSIEKNSFLIFKEVNSLLRQWGNTLAPNGFSVTLASVPANTLLYHARTDADEPLSPEWFAFDAEMSYGIYGGRKNTTVYLRTYQTTAPLGPLLYFNGLSAALMESTLDTQDLLAPPSNSTRPRDPFGDYARAKRLCSWASKRGIEGFVRTNAGFELIWCNMRDERVELLRNLDVTAWADDMNDHSDRSGSDEDGENRRHPWELIESVPPPSSTSAVTIATSPPFPRPPGRGPPGRGLNMFARYASWEWLRATSHVYNGLGEARVKLQSGWHATSRGIDLDSTGATRVAQLPVGSIEKWKEDVDRMLRLAIQEKRANSGIDWRALTDLVVDRYGDRLPELGALLKLAGRNTTSHITRPSVNMTHVLHAYRITSSILIPFYDRHASREQQVETCAFSIAPEIAAKDGGAGSFNSYELKIWTAILHVHRSICAIILDVHSELATLWSSRATLESSTLETLAGRIDDLMVQLDWPSWVRCPDVCPWGQVCFIPIWPLFGFGSWPRWPGGGRPEPQCVGSLVDPA